LNCDFVQGLLFGQPMTAADYFNLLQTEQQGEISHGRLFA